MNKVKIIILCFLLSSILSLAQNGQVGIDTSTPDQSAILHIENFKGTPATAVATIGGGAVTSVNIINGGSGYTSVPTVNFYDGGAIVNGGVKAVATAIVTNGVVTGITLNSGGSGYTSVPTITISGGNKGVLFPRLNIIDVSNTTNPVVAPADGLIGYNSGTNANPNTIHYFNSSNNKWESTVDAEATPKVSYLTFTGNYSALDNYDVGSDQALLTNPLNISAVSNIKGLKVLQNSGQNTLVLPQGAYVIELNLALNAPPASPSNINGTQPLSGSSHFIMGYYIDMYSDGYNNSTGVFTTTPYHAAGTYVRKEIPIISKVDTDHFATWSFYFLVPPNADGNIISAARFYLGRMSGSNFFDLVTVQPNKSYIKITKI